MPDNTVVVSPMADDYSFGVIQSSIHFEWFKARCSTLESRFRYTSNTVFDSFPWPQSPTRKQIEAVQKEALTLRQLRREVMTKIDWSLRELYRSLEESGSKSVDDFVKELVYDEGENQPRVQTGGPFISAPIDLAAKAMRNAYQKRQLLGRDLRSSPIDHLEASNAIRVRCCILTFYKLPKNEVG